MNGIVGAAESASSAKPAPHGNAMEKEPAGSPMNRSERRYRAVVDQSPDVIFSLDAQGRFTFVNLRVQELLGYASAEVIGRRLCDCVADEDKKILESLLETHPGTVWDNECNINDAWGSPKHVRIRCTPAFDADGKLAGLDGVMRDRTAQCKLQEDIAAYQRSLVASEKRYRCLVEDVPDVIFSLDEEGRFTFLNSQATQLFGYAADQMMGKPLWDHVAPDDKDSARSLQQVQDGCVWDEELSVIDLQRRTKWVRIRAKARFDSEGRLEGFEGIMRDRTLQKQLQEDIKASQQQLLSKIRIIDDLYEHIVQSKESRAIARHTAEVAHELRQPLAIIGGFARRMARQLEGCGKLDPNDQRECFQIIIREVKRLEGILTGLIDFNRHETLQLASADPNALIEEVLHVSEEQLSQKAIRLEIDFGEEAGEIQLDPDRFEQVIRNLLENALDASPQGGKIKIETAVFVPSRKASETGGLDSDSYFEMKIYNQGETIQDSDLARVFDPFFTTKETGSGIGLTVCKRIIDKHRGSISVKSDKEGTVFTVWMPLVHRGAQSI